MPLTPEELEDRKQRREFWMRVLTTLITALPSLMAAYYGYSNSTQIQKADVDRSRIEEKLDEQHATTKEAVTEARSAVEHAKVAAEETKTAVAVIKTKMGE